MTADQSIVRTAPIFAGFARSTPARPILARISLAQWALALLPALLLVAAIAAFAGEACAQSGPQTGTDTMDPRLTNPADVARYWHLAEELRCLVCQNQTLADSNASLAVDLRHQVEAMIVEGRSDDQIKSYLVDRYGEFVLFRPPVQRSTWVLWFGPFILLAGGAGVWFALQRQRRPGSKRNSNVRSGPDDGPAENNPGDVSTTAELDRARRLLDGN